MKTLKRNMKVLSVLLLVGVMFFTFSGFAFDASASLKHSGKGSAVLTFDSDKTLKEFKKALEKKVAGFNSISAVNTQVEGNRLLVVESVEETEKGYEVKVNFRRIDKINASGRFEYKKLSDYLESYIVNPNADGSTLVDENTIQYRSQTLVKWNRGDMTGVTVDTQDSLLSCKEKEDDSVKAVPQSIAGKTVEIDDFITQGKKASGNTMIFTFFLLGMEDLTDAQVTIPGKITYYAGENIKIIDENTVQITPATKTVQRQGTDNVESGQYDTGCLMGYVVYEKSISTGMIIAIILGVLVVAGMLIWGYFYFSGKGKREIAIFKVEKKGSYFGMGVKAAFQSETWKNVKRHKALYLFVLPVVVLLLIFNYIPMFGLAISFQDYNIQEGVSGSEFIGLAMFKRLFVSYSSNYRIFRNTIFIALIRIVTNFPIILISTLFVNEIKSKKAKTIVTTVSYIPYFISWVAIGGITHSLFAVDGLFNQVLTNLGVETINWYAETKYWWAILTITSLWKGLGWSTLIYISGLGLIHEELYEACKIDGGGKIRQAFTVTIPGIINVIIMQLILDIGGIMNDNYDQIRALTKGSAALDDVVRVVGAQEFTTTLSGLYTEGAAYSLVRGIIGFALVLLTNKLAKSTDNEGII